MDPTSRIISDVIDGNVATLEIQESVREDTGKYSLVATNVAGKATAHVRCNIVCIPSPIRNLKTTEVTESSVTLEWQMPEDDGGAPVNSYTLHMLEPEAESWTECAATIVRPVFKVKKLRLNKEYIFRVAAENKQGISQWVRSERITVKYPFRKPRPPEDLKVKCMTLESAHLEWNPPSTDGGSEILGYYVEYKDCLLYTSPSPRDRG